MIRKYIFAGMSFAIAGISQPLWSQDCTPVTLDAPGILPESLPFAQINQAYSETISVMLFSDTMVEANGQTVKAVMDSMVLIDVMGLPTGINYRCKNGNNTFLPLKSSCIALYGTPTVEGTFPLDIPIMSYAKVFGFVPITQGDTIKDYVLSVYDGATSITKIKANELSIFPNPASASLSVFSGEEPKVLAANGSLQLLQWRKEGRLFSADVSNLASGVYLIHAEGKSKRFIKP